MFLNNKCVAQEQTEMIRMAEAREAELESLQNQLKAVQGDLQVAMNTTHQIDPSSNAVEVIQSIHSGAHLVLHSSRCGGLHSSAPLR